VTPAQAAALAGLEIGTLLAVTGLPNAGPFTAARLYVEGWAEEWTADGWALDLDVTEYALTGPAVRWVDIGQQLTWRPVFTRGLVPNTLLAPPYQLTWLQALGWSPPPFDAGRWADQPADLQWQDVDTETTWATA
jgi:hypothetical protein